MVRKSIKNKRVQRSKILFLIIFILGVAACSHPKTVYYRFKAISQEHWNKKDTLSFDVSIDSLLKKEQHLIEVQSRIDYTCKYSELKLVLLTYLNDSLTSKSDTLTYDLLSDFKTSSNNTWGMKTIKFPELTIEKDTNRTFKLKIVHAMQADSIIGVKDVGIYIKE